MLKSKDINYSTVPTKFEFGQNLIVLVGEP